MGYIEDNIVEYDNKRPNHKQIEKALCLRCKFVEDYSLTRLQSWTENNIDDYIIGKGEQTFCCRLEHELISCGNILGSPSFKFGVYYSKNKRKYIPTLKYGSTKEEAFNKVKEEIITLLKAGANEDIDIVKNSILCPTLRGKILFLYYPDKYLPIYDSKHLDFFIGAINLATKKTNADILEKQQSLIEWKNKNALMKNWSLLEFQNFLYHIFGNPNEINCDKEKELGWLKKVYNQMKNKKRIFDYTIVDTPKNKPKEMRCQLGSYYARDPKVARNALIDAKHCCEYNHSHPTFERKNCDENYTEPHHLIPMCFQKNFNNSLDVEANIVSLCSNCHNQIHYGKGAEQIIKTLFAKRKKRLKDAGIEITEEQLLSMYRSCRDEI